MEYVQGTNLAQQFESFHYRVPANLLLKWMRQICCALKGLHTLVPPLIHRDLKPDNILLGIDLNVRVVDFGLAARLMYKGYVPGSIGPIKYMAPETIKGESVPASDVYTIGLVMYEGLTGQLPFAHLIPPVDLPQTMHGDWLYRQMSTICPSKPSSLNNTVTPQLDAVVLRCLKFKIGGPDGRFSDAGELLKALDHLDDGDAPPPPEDVIALNEGRRLMTSGDLKGACRSFKHGLKVASSSNETHFALLRELGEVLVVLKECPTAAERLVEAWKLAENSAILRRLKERVLLLEELAGAFRLCGNDYMANTYKNLALKERQKGRS
jgi:serine/threonine protein kinase